MGLIKSGNVIDQPQSSHLGPNSFQHPETDAILLTEKAEIGKELVFGVFEFDEDS